MSALLPGVELWGRANPMIRRALLSASSRGQRVAHFTSDVRDLSGLFETVIEQSGIAIRPVRMPVCSGFSKARFIRVYLGR
ncbi:hypothetical protein KUV65_06540 [Maritalea mobilis]|uniref:hypothetical protein n=1 Tax=Maritalea mobilis TaxID=483324 RepID=UPI001C975C36|nr:hypothetical protein [Maritalea mobilis]MBY6201013.1 hypothetical protein [Maritalea mobilis]